jgi:hypothetical protein
MKLVARELEMGGQSQPAAEQQRRKRTLVVSQFAPWLAECFFVRDTNEHAPGR